MIKSPRDLNKFLGCMVGGAAGDALGFSVEFLRLSEILIKYGHGGIREYELRGGVAGISDDTQMTAFTANGILLARAAGVAHDDNAGFIKHIRECYLDWLSYQCFCGNDVRKKCSWLCNVPTFTMRRAPGRTCITALSGGNIGTISKPINNSKGCGGVMRVSPIGLYFIGRGVPIENVMMLAAETSALTHGHELGYIPSAILAGMIFRLADGNNEVSIPDATKEAIEISKTLFPASKDFDYQINLLNIALKLAAENANDREALYKLGEGWVAEETLAIAVFCAAKYYDDFDKVLITSVNHDGDSDSTGQVTGAILGAYIGYENIPQKYKENLEAIDVIKEISVDLFEDKDVESFDERLVKKYK